ncbi:HutD family protein [Companilactobacillus sp. HBUAS56275]|uniref:HutD family protein n=1 Tax=Candidatus Companilactobacillus pullicola TaxID=2838523 RepID=A0A9D1ZLQ0_9LACO|nr:HutD family protein [Candidatus Companilactobacillus pullicola]
MRKEISQVSSSVNLTTLTENDYQVSNWSGGKTKELYMRPQTSKYLTNDFDYRVSSATVEQDQTRFTSLPGYKRIILPLHGELALEHTTQRVNLVPYQQHAFDGGEITNSYGRCTDFNLIYRRNFHGEIIPVRHQQTFEMDKGIDIVCYFLTDCTFKYSDPVESLQKELHANETLIVNSVKQKSKLTISSDEKNSSEVLALLVLIDKNRKTIT